MTAEPNTRESLKKSIIEALSYPREVLRSYIELESCPHNGLYDGQDGRCTACPQKAECEWLYSNETFAALDQKPFEDVLAALNEGLEYVQISCWRHSRQCQCTSCAWIRDARRLSNKARTL